MDHGSRAYKISELAQRHGGDAWLDPLIDEFGPLVQRQLGDAADYLEILIKYALPPDARSCHGQSLTSQTVSTIGAIQEPLYTP